MIVCNHTADEMVVVQASSFKILKTWILAKKAQKIDQDIPFTMLEANESFRMTMATYTT